MGWGGGNIEQVSVQVRAHAEHVDAQVELEAVDEERLRHVRLHDRVLAESDALRLPRQPDAAPLTRRRRLHDVRLAALRRRVRLQVAEAAHTHRSQHTHQHVHCTEH